MLSLVAEGVQVHQSELLRPEGLEHSLPSIHIEGVAKLVEVLRAA